MKKLIIILFLSPLLVFSQYTTEFNEWNIGFPPGVSYTWGKTIYFDNNMLIDYQYGVAFPSIGTAKISFGIGGDNFATLVGFRLFPLLTSLQFNFDERHVFSVEISPSVYSDFYKEEDWMVDQETGEAIFLGLETPYYDQVWMEFAHPSMSALIVTYGWRF